ncbi:hypothetical protein TVAG_240520 [Trichomonas vaginalis G3]|uniref:Uncharacterized protein n=1 Tax=Trichomonas vaginalis (strain ATCC PRA-98 / G3) TaxID=412133 RepID=A2EJ99_TRIV3|nr:hypothetical protein TVAGG3_0315030 [Trichomonas vaginalis G3]EAY07251.1 hypothetical protein TVAG_240520 [Trichomonas vaginalis G3]KAI5528892.1 hypothetical protein TVAGG3_0315030 [Trichomonas vaginalis G3]|eukprot:XP_001319474.1 hypothetical protein [Trichomonas vaginalis G3]
MDPPVEFLDEADIFTVRPSGGKSSKKSTKHISARRNRFNGKEALKKIKMCRVEGADPICYNKSTKSASNEADFKQLQKSVQDLIMRSKESDSKPFNRTKARSVAIEYDEYGRMVPKDRTHMLNAQEMKEITQIATNLIDNTHSLFDKSKPSQSAKHFSTIIDSFKEKVFGDLIDDYKARCPFVGNLLQKILYCLEYMIENICDVTIDLETSSEAALSKSISDFEMFKQKIIELKSRPPETVEKVVVVEKTPNTTILGKTKELEQEVETLQHRVEILHSQCLTSKKAIAIWKDATLEISRLSATDIKTLELKREKWQRVGEGFIKTLKSKTKELISNSEDLANLWNDKAVVLFSVCCKSQSTVLLHIKSIADNCAKYYTKIINDYNNLVLDHPDSTKYQEFMLNGEMKRMADDFQAWSKIIEEWEHLDENEGILTARETSMDILQTITQLKKTVLKPEFSTFVPETIPQLLGEYQDKMDIIINWMTKPTGDNSIQQLTPISRWLNDTARLLNSSLQGKISKFRDSNGVVDSLQVRAIAFKLNSFSKDLDEFVTKKTDRLVNLQKTIPEVTFCVTKIVDDLSNPLEDSIHSLEVEFEEDTEIAQAWAILTGTGCQGPFKLVSEKTIGFDFVKNYGKRLKDWIETVKSKFDIVLSPGTFDEFELYLHDWFDTAESIVKNSGKFLFDQTTQTDPVRIADSTIEFNLALQNSRSSSEASFMSTLSRVATETSFNLNLFTKTTPFLLFDISPNMNIQKKRQAKMRNFSGIRTSFVTNERPASPVKVVQNNQPVAWTVKMIREMFEYRKQHSQEFEYAGNKYYFSKSSAENLFKDFATSKTSKQNYRDLLRKITEGISTSKKDSDPLLYVALMLKNEKWNRHTFNFATTILANANESSLANPIKFAETLFSPFGFSIVNIARNVVGQFMPASIDELLYLLCFCFENILQSRFCESMCLMKRFGDKDTIDREKFNSFLSNVKMSLKPENSEQLIKIFFGNSNRINEFDFRCLCLYCGIFSASGVIEATPQIFGLSRDSRLLKAKEMIENCKYKSAATELSKVISPLFHDAVLDDYSAYECCFTLEHSVNVLLRCISTAYSQSTFITLAPPTEEEKSAPLESPLVPRDS